MGISQAPRNKKQEISVYERKVGNNGKEGHINVRSIREPGACHVAYLCPRAMADITSFVSEQKRLGLDGDGV